MAEWTDGWTTGLLKKVGFDLGSTLEPLKMMETIFLHKRTLWTSLINLFLRLSYKNRMPSVRAFFSFVPTHSASTEFWMTFNFPLKSIYSILEQADLFMEYRLDHWTRTDRETGEKFLKTWICFWKSPEIKTVFPIFFQVLQTFQ